MDNRRTGLDRRDHTVKQTLAAIHALSDKLEADRTVRTGEYRICYRVGSTAICRYATTSTEAIAVAKRLVDEHR